MSDHTQERELLPCPFCGGTDVFVERLDYSAAYVQCDSAIDEHCACLARGPVGVQDDDDEEIPGAAAAIRAWNRRSIPQGDELPPLPALPPRAAYGVKSETGFDPANKHKRLIGVNVHPPGSWATERQVELITVEQAQQYAREYGAACYAIGRGAAVSDYVNLGAACRASAGAAVEADRAQQGEPVDVRYEFERWMSGQGEAANYIGDGLYSCGAVTDQAEAFAAGVEVARAATKAAAPADVPSAGPMRQCVMAWVEAEQARRDAIKSHNDAFAEASKEPWPGRDIDTEYQAMNEAANKEHRVRLAMFDTITRAAPVPDTGIPTSDPRLRAALKPFAGAYALEAERVAKFCTPEDMAKYGAAFDRNTITPAVTMGDFRRAHEALRAPVSGIPTPGEVEDRQDAARYRWLLDQFAGSLSIDLDCGKGEISETIDAARAQQGGAEKGGGT